MIAASLKSKPGATRATETEIMKKLIALFLMLIVSAGIVAYYFYNQPVDSLIGHKADVTIQADSLFSEFENDEQAANAKYLNKVLLVSGRIQSLSSDTGGTTINIQSGQGMFGVSCRLDDKSVAPDFYTVGQHIRLKGICSGYLMDVVLIRCVPAE